MSTCKVEQRDWGAPALAPRAAACTLHRPLHAAHGHARRPILTTANRAHTSGEKKHVASLTDEMIDGQES